MAWQATAWRAKPELVMLASFPSLSRRQFATTLFWAVGARLGAGEPKFFDLQIASQGFGEASGADMRAVLQSAAQAIWEHCATTRFTERGWHIYHRAEVPLTNFAHTADGRISIGLATKDRYWAQYAFQFAHEFCHALADHSNDWRHRWHTAEQSNLWFEEALCETASLFALRAMGRSWKTEPPFQNWRSFAPELTRYAQDRLDDPKHQLPAGTTFPDWFANLQPSLRKNGTERDRNGVIAAQLLPLFEAEPAGWDAVAGLNIGERRADKSFEQYVAEWKTNAPAGSQALIERVAARFIP